MSKKNIALFVVLLVLGAIYIFNFTNLFRSEGIEISTRIRPVYSRHSKSRGTTPTENSVSFLLNGRYELTSVEVVEEADAKTNRYPHPLWHLISESNSVPTKALVYGFPIKGMKSEFEKIRPEQLRTNVFYILMLQAGDLKGQTSFKLY